MKHLKLKTLLPKNLKIRINEEKIDPEVKNVFDDVMKSISSQMKSAISDVENELKGKSEEELEKIAADTDPLLGKLAQESVYSIKRTIKERSNNKRGRINEEFGFMFFAGLALALPPIIELIGKLSKIISKKLGGSGEVGEKIAHFGHELHEVYHEALRRLLDMTLFKLPSLKIIDERGKKQITDALFMLIIVYMAIYSGSAAVNAIKGLEIGPAVAESALAAIKSGEVTGWVINTIKDVIS
jgi:hypothetical protein